MKGCSDSKVAEEGGLDKRRAVERWMLRRERTSGRLNQHGESNGAALKCPAGLHAHEGHSLFTAEPHNPHLVG
jgi:hypothetical protein